MRILIAGHLRPCHEKLHAHGHRTVLFIPQDRILPKDLSLPHESVVALDADSPSETWVEIASVLHKATPFDCVVCYSDLYQHLAWMIAQRLNVFTVADNDLLEKTKNKFLMRQALDARNIAHCRYRFARGEDAIRQAVRDVGTPCILKPVAGQASAGVVKLEAESGLAQALEWVGGSDIDRGVMVEEFLVGEEFSVEAISEGGRHHLVAITKKYIDEKTFIEIGHVVPAPIDDAAKAAIESYTREVLTGLGFRDGPSHTELILTRGGLRIVETHTRLGGDKIIDLVLHASGIDLYELVARQSVGMPISGELPPVISYSRSAAIWYAAPDIYGTYMATNT
jgi:biotin carboxylase